MFSQRTIILPLFILVLLVACGNPAGPQSSAPNILFEDNFDGFSSGQWRLEADESGATMMSDGTMVINVNAPNVLQYTTLLDHQFDEFDLAVDAAFMNSASASTLGVLLGLVGPDTFLRFEITDDGRYMVERLNPGNIWTRYLDDWQKSPAIVTGFGAANRLRIVARGSEISFFINDELLLKLPDSPQVAGQIGLDAGTFGEAGTRVAFDNLIIRQP